MFGSQLFYPKTAYLCPAAPAKAVQEPVQWERQWLLLCKELMDVTGKEEAEQTRAWSVMAEVKSTAQLFTLVSTQTQSRAAGPQCPGEGRGRHRDPSPSSPVCQASPLLSTAGKLCREGLLFSTASPTFPWALTFKIVVTFTASFYFSY